MKLRSVGVILAKDFYQGPKNFLFIWAIVAPLLISFVFSFALGGFFTDQPRLGIYDEGTSRLLETTEGFKSVSLERYSSRESLRNSVNRGSLDMGIVLPDGLEESLTSGETIDIQSYVWGSSTEGDRAIIRTSLLSSIRETIGDEPPLEVEFATVGEGDFTPWKDRLLPLLVLMAVFLGGAFLPGGSLIEEKERDTLRALVTSPATLGEILLAKAVIGIVVSLFVGVAILFLNGAFGSNPLLLILTLALGGIMASGFGLILGILLDDLTSLLAFWKAGGILLFAPGFVYLFPEIPQWVGKIIPTYYYVSPVIKISQEGSGWKGIAGNIYILLGINLALILLTFFMAKRTERRAT